MLIKLHQLIAKLYLKPIRAWSSLSLVYQLIAVLIPSHSGGVAKVNLCHQRRRESSDKKMVGWTQPENLLLGRQYQFLSIDPLSEANLS